MARLFITPREINFISDITKELIKDVVGQKIIYYPISEIHTKTHEFGIDAQYKIEVFIQHRDLVEKGINVNIGDFFSFSDVFYEITERSFMRNIYGMPEHKDGVRLVGTKARDSQFIAPLEGPTDIKYTDPDAVQETFVQQRGNKEDSEGNPTGDVRDLVKNGVLDPPLTGPKEISNKGDSPEGTGSNFNKGSAFYDED
jgi:hypothetical protein